MCCLMKGLFHSRCTPAVQQSISCSVAQREARPKRLQAASFEEANRNRGSPFDERMHIQRRGNTVDGHR